MNAIDVRGLTVMLSTAGHRRPVLDNVDIMVTPGRSLGIVGESGSGKSLLSHGLLGEFPRSADVTGSIRIDGSEVIGAGAGKLRTLRQDTIAMVFQDPRASVNPTHRIGDFLTEGVRRTGKLGGGPAHQRAVEMLAALQLRDPEAVMRRYPYELSGGMLQRVVIAAALMPEPKVLLCDEATTALDVTTQAEIVSILGRLVRELGTTLVFVTHDLDLAADVCDEIAVLYAGQVLETGPVDEVLARPRNPYTAALRASIPRMSGDPAQPLPVIPGTILPLDVEQDGCVFADRCAYTAAACAVGSIPVHDEAGHRTRCIHTRLPRQVPA